MEENEIDITKNRDELKQEIEANGRSVVGSRMYKDMDFAKDDESLHTSFDIIFVQEKLEDGKVFYEIFDSQKNRIGTADASGKITYDEEFKEKCKDVPLDLEENARALIEKNKDKEFKDDNKDKSGYDDKLHKELDEERKPEEEENPEQEENEEDIEDKENLSNEELDEAVSKDMGENVLVSNVLEATMPVGGNKTLEDKVGSPGKYVNFAEIQAGGQLRIVGLNRDTGKYENIDSMQVVTDYDAKFAGGDGQMINSKARTMYQVTGTDEGVAIMEKDGATSLAAMKYDPKGKSAVGVEIPGTNGYVKDALENSSKGTNVAKEMADKDKDLEQTTGEGLDKVQDGTIKGNITYSLGDDEIIVLKNGEKTSISDLARRSGKPIEAIRDKIDEKTAGGGSLENAAEVIIEECRDMSLEPDEVDREPYFNNGEEN